MCKYRFIVFLFLFVYSKKQMPLFPGCSIEPSAFVERMPEFVVLDCRPFWSYGRKHIVNAIHVNCRADIIRRRLKSGKLSVIDLIPDAKCQASLITRRFDKQFVVYDEYGRDVKCLPEDHGSVLVFRSLQREGAEAKILKGGMKEFEKFFPDLCTNNID